MTDSTTPIAALHAAWEAATGQKLNPRATERVFWELHRAEIKADDIRCVVTYMQRFNRKHAGGPQFRINVQKVCGDLEEFAANLGEARADETARARSRPPTAAEAARAHVLREAHTTVRTTTPPPEPTKTSTQALTQALDELKRSLV